MKKISVKLKTSKHKKGTHIIIDGSGLSVHGADTFYKSKRGIMRVKGYRRLHIAINEHQEIVACELTTIHGNESAQVPKLLRQVKDHCDRILADKNYDTKQVYDAIKKYRPTRFIRPVKRDEYHVTIPPEINARARKTKKSRFPIVRSEHINMIKDRGVMDWQKATGYGERSLVKTTFYRYKRLIGQLMHTINFENQINEAKLACKAINIMTELGMPKTQRIS